MRVDAETERDRIETTARRQGAGMGCEVATVEVIGGGATIEDVPWVKAAAEDERVDLATELEVVVEEALRGVVPRSSVLRLLRSPTIVDISSNLAGARRFRPLLLLIGSDQAIHCRNDGTTDTVEISSMTLVREM